MTRHLTLGLILLALITLGAAPAPASSSGLIVHEWGTFRSLAGSDGKAVAWRPLDGPPDLPGFVERFRFNLKSSLAAKVRMETPVLYFYAADETTVNVHVRFRQGAVTEWFPRATVTPASIDQTGFNRPDFASDISWTGVKVSPRARDDFRVDGSGSHYYVARRTDASPLQAASEKEKFLFYRGVGAFEPPISATVAADGRVSARSPDGEPLGDVILFDNRGGSLAYQVRHAAGSQFTFEPPAHDGEFAAPLSELETLLIAHGLYPREARAMIDTWRDAWFGEGTRLFYIVPRPFIDAILPLDITPAPAGIARVFVGRIEIRN